MARARAKKNGFFTAILKIFAAYARRRPSFGDIRGPQLEPHCAGQRKHPTGYNRHSRGSLHCDSSLRLFTSRPGPDSRSWLMVVPDHIALAAARGDVDQGPDSRRPRRRKLEAVLPPRSQGDPAPAKPYHPGPRARAPRGDASDQVHPPPGRQRHRLDHPILLARDKLRNTSRLVPHVRQPHHARHGLAVVREALDRVRPNRPGNELVPPRQHALA